MNKHSTLGSSRSRDYVRSEIITSHISEHEKYASILKTLNCTLKICARHSTYIFYLTFKLILHNSVTSKEGSYRSNTPGCCGHPA